MKSFASIGAFVAHLERIAAAAPQHELRALRDAGRVIQAETRAELGTYQAAAGPFGEWPSLTDFTQRERERLGFTANDPLKASGELHDHIDLSFDAKQAVVGVPDETVGDGTEANPIRNIGDVAIDLEMGTQHMPARSFLGRAAFAKGHEAVDAAALTITDAIAGRSYRAPKINPEAAPF